MASKLAIYRFLGVIVDYNFVHRDAVCEISFLGPLSMKYHGGEFIDLRYAHRFGRSRSDEIEMENDVVSLVENNALLSSLALVRSIIMHKVSTEFLYSIIRARPTPVTSDVTEWDNFYKYVLKSIDELSKVTPFTDYMKIRSYQRLDAIEIVDESSNESSHVLTVRILGQSKTFHHTGFNHSNALHRCRSALLAHVKTTLPESLQTLSKMLLEGIIKIEKHTCITVIFKHRHFAITHRHDVTFYDHIVETIERMTKSP